MKKIFGAVVSGVFLFTSLSFAQTASDTKVFNGDNWLSMSKRDRVAVIKSFVSSASKKGITIKKSAVFYARKLDNLYSKEDARKEQVANTLKTFMIMEYDWAEPGISKEENAKKWLGDDLYKKNKERIASKR